MKWQLSFERFLQDCKTSLQQGYVWISGKKKFPFSNIKLAHVINLLMTPTATSVVCNKTRMECVEGRFSLCWKKKNVHTAQPIYKPCIPVHANAASVFGKKNFPLIDHKNNNSRRREVGEGEPGRTIWFKKKVQNANVKTISGGSVGTGRRNNV